MAYYGCEDYTLIVDRGYWSIYNVCLMYNLGVNFLAHIKISHGTIKKFIEKHIDDLSVGNGCQKIARGNEVNYARCFELNWKYYDLNSRKRVTRPIYIYAYYNSAIAYAQKAKLEDEVRELNEEYSDYRKAVVKAKTQHKKIPEKPPLKIRYQELLNSGIIRLNTEFNRYDICNEAAFKYCQLNAVWLFASTQKDTCEENFLRYRQRNEIEIMYRYFKNHVEADTLNVSSENNFRAKLFIGLIASEFLNSLKMRINKWNSSIDYQSNVVKLKDNSMYMTFKDLDSIECIYHNKTIIPTTNILKRHEDLFLMLDLDPNIL